MAKDIETIRREEIQSRINTLFETRAKLSPRLDSIIQCSGTGDLNIPCDVSH
jgi:hypothetical protein